MTDTVTIHVLKGTRVDVKEIDRLTDDDHRIPDDREAIIQTKANMKIAIKTTDEDLKSKGSVVLRCG